MRGIAACVFLCCLIGSSHAGEREASLVNSFQVMCTLEPLDFARADAKASAMHLKVRQDLHNPSSGQGDVHSKSWLLPLKTGVHEFTVAEAQGPKGEVKSCGIGAPDVSGDAFRAELVGKMKLEKPVRESISRDGSRRITVWTYGPDRLDLMLTDGTPRAQPGIYLLLLKRPLAG